VGEGRKKRALSRGGVLFWALMSGEILSWAIEMRAVWRAELRGGSWDASFCGEKGGCPSCFLYGERYGFSGLAEGMRLREGGFAL
jgi:hypothetical protein